MFNKQNCNENATYSDLEVISKYFLDINQQAAFCTERLKKVHCVASLNYKIRTLEALVWPDSLEFK